MNKQEVVKLVEQMGEYERFVDEPVSKKSVLSIISQIQEPEKPVVPQFVAEWYEDNKNFFEWSLYNLCIDFHKRELQDDLFDWFKLDVNKPIETLVNMHQFGYEVKKEKLYTVEIPDTNSNGYTKVYLGRNEDNKVGLCIWGCCSSIEFVNNWKQLDSAQLTESEIKKDYSWAWQFAEEVEK